MATFGVPIAALISVCLASATVAHLTDDLMAEQTQVGFFSSLEESTDIPNDLSH